MRPLETSASAPAEYGCVPGTCGRDELPSGHNGLEVSGLSFGWSYISCMPRSQLVSAMVGSTHNRSLAVKRRKWLPVIPEPRPFRSADTRMSSFRGSHPSHGCENPESVSSLHETMATDRFRIAAARRPE